MKNRNLGKMVKPSVYSKEYRKDMNNRWTIEMLDGVDTWDIYEGINNSSKWSSNPLKVGIINSKYGEGGETGKYIMV